MGGEGGGRSRLAPTLVTGAVFVVGRGVSVGVGSGVVSEPLSLVPVGRDLFVPPVPGGASRGFGKDHREAYAYVVSQARSEGLLLDHEFDIPLAPVVSGLEPRAERVLRERCLTVLACLERIAAAYHSDPELREFLDVPCPLREWVLADERATERRIDYCRFDVIGDHLPDLRVLEFNGEYPLGLLTTGLLARYWRRAPVVGELISGWNTTESLIEGDTWLIDELLALGATQGVGGEHVALLCAAQFRAFPEIVLLAQQARRRGLVPVIVEPQELVSEPGVRLAFLVYPTFALLAGLAGYPALAERILTGELVVSNGITGRAVGSNKLALAVMSDPRFQRLFTGVERDAIAALVPWSRKLGAGMSADEALAQREDVVLKAPYEAQSRAVYIGREHSPARWRELVESAARQGWLVQEFVSSQRIVTQDGAFYRTLGVGIANGHVVGYTARLSTSLLATFVTGGGVQSVFASDAGTTYHGHAEPI